MRSIGGWRNKRRLNTTIDEFMAAGALKHQLSRQVLVAPGVLASRSVGYRQKYRQSEDIQHWRGFPGDSSSGSLSRSIEVYRVRHWCLQLADRTLAR
jgi:hypothetical protein